MERSSVSLPSPLIVRSAVCIDSSVTLLLKRPFLLAGTARWEMPLRAGGTAGFCFVAAATPSGFVVPPRNKTKSEVSWLPHKKAALGTCEQAPLALFVPREKRAQKRRKNK